MTATTATTAAAATALISDPTDEQVAALIEQGTSRESAVWLTCGKCSGSGSISWGIEVHGAVIARDEQGQVTGSHTTSRICFACHGERGEMTTLRVVNRRRNARNRRTLRREAEALTRRVERENYRAAHEEVFAALDRMHGAFAESLRARFTEHGTLTEPQIEAVLRISRERAEAAPVPEGRQKVVGTVLSTKEVYTDFGLSVKMMVRDDRGFRVWGTVPRNLLDSIEAGRRIEFTGTLRPSDDDEAFGFVTRPTKAALV